ncbi:hypothetical protein JCM10207_000761 [Rhodosporidiobolus poonsookiae]
MRPSRRLRAVPRRCDHTPTPFASFLALIVVASLARAAAGAEPPFVASAGSVAHRRGPARMPHFPSARPTPVARVHFNSGAIREVPATAGDEEGHYAQQLGDDSVEAIDVPLGTTLWWKTEQGKERRKSGPWTCTRAECAEAVAVRLEPDVMAGLRYWDGQGARDQDQVLSVPACHLFPPDSVTLATHFTLSRLNRFERLLDSWDGPVSATIYLTDATDIRQLLQHISRPFVSARWRKISLTIVKPDYSATQSALLRRLRYPINRLRNLALEAAASDYTLLVDVDFVPSVGMHTRLRTHAGRFLRRFAFHDRSSPTWQRTAIVIPTFALATTSNRSLPLSIAALSELASADLPAIHLTDRNAGHGPTLPSLLFRQARRRAHHSGSATPPFLYPLTYEPQWEPYYLLARASHPLYDERFTDQGGDKQAHALVLNVLGFDFRVATDVAVVHPPKTDLQKEAWPSARLVDSNSTVAEHDRMLEVNQESADHFNLAAQKDEARFRYFQDLLPEVTRAWGWNARWPRASGARFVGERSFGRGKATGAFGL